MIAIKLVYIANIIVAGGISLSSLFSSQKAVSNVFTNAYSHSPLIQLVGSLWLAIALCSIGGLFFPEKFSLILLVQLIYKGTWLLVVALPAQLNQAPFPKSMAYFFIVWVLVLPFIIPWKVLFS